MESHSTFKAVEIVDRGFAFNHIGVHVDPEQNRGGVETYPFAIAPAAIESLRGSMLVSWTAGAYEIAPNTVIMGRETYDWGKNWDYDSHVMIEHAKCGVIGGAFVRSEKQLFRFYNTYMGRARSAHGYYLDGTEDIWVASAEDHAYCWSEPRRLTDYFETHQPYSVGTRQNGIMLSSGKLIVPVFLMSNYWPVLKPDQKRGGFGVIRSAYPGQLTRGKAGKLRRIRVSWARQPAWLSSNFRMADLCSPGTIIPASGQIFQLLSRPTKASHGSGLT